MTVDQYIVDHVACNRAGQHRLVPDTGDVPARIAAALDRRFGRASAVDRGEIAYWVLDDATLRRLGLVDP